METLLILGTAKLSSPAAHTIGSRYVYVEKRLRERGHSFFPLFGYSYSFEPLRHEPVHAVFFFSSEPS